MSVRNGEKAEEEFLAEYKFGKNAAKWVRTKVRKFVQFLSADF